MTAPHQAVENVAIVYDKNENPDNLDISGIIDGIEKTPDVVVYRIALQTGRADVSTVKAVRSVLLAYNGDPAGIAVIYPDLGEPYLSVFSKIIEGIEHQNKARVASFPVGANQNPADLANELRRQGIHIVIALGRNGLKAVNGLDRDFEVVVGGIISAPEAETRGMAVLSLTPDPYLLFERLKSMVPGVRRVFVVYEPNQNAWLIRLAREAARNLGLELVAQEAPDRKTAMRFYQDDIAAVDPKKDALWLPQDSVTVEESLVLPLVLQEAWSRNLVVFSSSVVHVKRGVLFSLYPDNRQLGRRLASSALNRSSLGNQPGRNITPLKEVLMAVNVRTASHLGLDLDNKQNSFDLVFPEQ